MSKKDFIEKELIDEAINFAREKHKNQKDDDGNSYFDSHILHVLNILKQVVDDEEVLAASVLHDIIEDTNTSYEELVNIFGESIANLVMEVTHEGKKDNFGFYFPRLKSRKAILIKFADRLSNLSRMTNWPIKRQQHYLKNSKFWKSEIQEYKQDHK